MRKSEWSDDQLEELLRDMPKIQDHRNPRDIYQNIESKLNRRKQKAWVIPSIAAAAAFLLFLVLSPNLLNWEDSAGDSSESMNDSTGSEAKMETAKMEDVEENAEAEAESTGLAESSEEGTSDITQKSILADSNSAIYEEEVMDQEVFTFAIPDKNVQLAVPVSITVPKEEGKSKFDLFKEAMPKLQEEEWGLSDFYPLDAKLDFDENTNELKVDVPEDHYYSDGAASELAFIKVLNDSLAMLGIDKVSLSTEGSSGIMFGNTGKLTEYTTTENTKQAYYFFYHTEGEKPYLVPYKDNESYSTFEEALETMKKDIETHGLQASIPPDLEFDVTIPSDDLIVIRLADNSQLTDSDTTTYMIEAILLTAKDFNFNKVKIENAPISQSGKFVFNEEWKVPVAPNRQFINE